MAKKPQSEPVIAAKVEAAKPEAPKPAPAPRYSFPTVSRCTRCGSTETRRTSASASGQIQYRQCQAPVCRHRYSVLGTKV